MTDGFSNGGDPRPEAKYLRDNGVKIFTFGIRNGNVRELLDMASDPKNETSYILDSFEEFEALARRALHEGKGLPWVLLIPIFFFCPFREIFSHMEMSPLPVKDSKVKPLFGTRGH